MENNVVEKKNPLVPVVVVLTVLVLVLGGFLVYDKIINKEKPPIKENENIGESIVSLKEIELTEENQIVKIGDKGFKLKVEDNYLFINDKKAYFDEEPDNTSAQVIAEGAYVTNKYILFYHQGMCGEYIDYAIN